MPKYTLTHNQCRAKLCVVCFEPKKALRDVTNNLDFIKILKANVGQNFDISNPRIPTGLCTGCRLAYFIQKAENRSFSIPQYLQFVVAPENVDEPCECAICIKVRTSGGPSGLMKGKPKSNAGRKPSSSPNIQRKQPKSSPIDLCSICLVPKGPEHNSTRLKGFSP